MTCGCKRVNDTMSDSRNITLDDVISAGEVQNQTFEQTIKNFLEAIPLAVKELKERQPVK